MLVPMKPLTPAEARALVQLRLPIELRNRLVVRATKRDVSLNQLCIELLEEAIK